MRPEWPNYFMSIAKVVATRATCLRGQVGAVIVRDKRILSTGYNGAPRGIEHCKTCMRDELNIPSGERHELCKAVHAEANAVIQAAAYGISIKDADMYCTHSPCSMCAKMMINAQIKTIYYAKEYKDALATRLLAEAGIQLIYVPITKEST